MKVFATNRINFCAVGRRLNTGMRLALIGSINDNGIDWS